MIVHISYLISQTDGQKDSVKYRAASLLLYKLKKSKLLIFLMHQHGKSVMYTREKGKGCAEKGLQTEEEGERKWKGSMTPAKGM